MYVAIAAAAFVIAWALLALEAGAAPTWFYILVWYPTLALLDALAARRSGRPAILTEPARAWSLVLWSAPIWFLFETMNFRLQDWYYVFLPATAVARWVGITASFATVIPAVILAERLLEAYGVGERWRGRGVRVRVRPRDLALAQVVGTVVLAATLALPRLLYPLVWGGVLLLAEPYVYRRRQHLSLFHDLEQGEWGRVGRLMIGGLGIGLLWEGYNYWARGKWIYTVPLLEHLKLFEMPPAGFLGFPFFALEAWALYHVLCAAKVAVPAYYPPRVAQTNVAWAGACAVLFSVLTLGGLERWTISSVTPVAPTASVAGASGGQGQVLDPFAIAGLTPDTLASRAGLSRDSAALLVRAAQLVTLKGIGTMHTAELARAGVYDVCHLGRSDPDSLWRWIRQSTTALGLRPTRDEVGVWVAAAQRACPPRGT